MKPTNRKRRFIIAAIFVLAIMVCAVAFAADGDATNPFMNTLWAAVPPVVAIALALITKEVYLSLFLGIFVGSLFIANFGPIDTVLTVFVGADGSGGMVGVLADSWNVGILIFTVALGIVGSLVYKAGGSAAYGKWAEKNIKTRRGAQFATFALGVLIFVDDYFNCLTVGNVMRPVTDKHGISRAKLAYLVDSTAAPVCIIAPISSWAAAVAGSLESTGNFSRFELFTNSIPYNYYALLTLAFIVTITILQFDFGPMKKHEDNAKKGDLYTTAARPYENAAEEKFNEKGKVIDLVLPIVTLIIFCIIGLLYTGGWELFYPGSGVGLQDAFADCDASLGLVYGSFIALLLMFIYFLARKVMTLKEYADCLVSGFRAMVPAVLILIFAWTLSNVTLSLGLRDVVETFVRSQSESLQSFLPAIICLIAMGLSFATGTSWGTFGMLLPIVISVFPFDGPNANLAFVGIAACLSGAVFGDHCSPISDTTIMSSAGAQSDHINHVLTQMPYAVSVGVTSLVFFLIAGFFPSPILLPVAIAAIVGVVFVIRIITNKKESKNAKA